MKNVVVLMLGLLGGGLCLLDETNSQSFQQVSVSPQMPPGFVLVTDGNGNYRFRMPGGSITGFESTDKQEVADYAWKLYRYMNDDRVWTPVERRN